MDAEVQVVEHTRHLRNDLLIVFVDLLITFLVTGVSEIYSEVIFFQILLEPPAGIEPATC